MTIALLKDPNFADAKIIFANTGKEEEETLQFVNNVDSLIGGLRGLNFDLKAQQEIMDGVNKGIATFGLQGEESKRVYLALGQIASKGVVSAEELRQQIGEVV